MIVPSSASSPALQFPGCVIISAKVTVTVQEFSTTKVSELTALLSESIAMCAHLVKMSWIKTNILKKSHFFFSFGGSSLPWSCKIFCFKKVSKSVVQNRCQAVRAATHNKEATLAIFIFSVRKIAIIHI